ncbi:YkyA family protein [Psychrobacillus sp. Sa2BUA9]|uniref:YkyA family protein n=1 Tax=Psychrobacillus faecigallinarum TaxID=2762235 RepID=A0ABR8R4Z1_9BACI|nr:YkyA family protein [Psychrobacillus faecigallinarum]MBD7942860.1 YkyA family protein [Psychrobacillus faecigallinarum]
MKKIKFIIPLSMLLLLTACSFGESTEEKLSNVLTEIYETEKGYREVQPLLAETELKELTNFQSMMELTQDQQDELSAQVEATATLLEERLALVKKEKESIAKANEKLADLEAVISDAKEESEKESIRLVEEALNNRYAAHDKLVEQYNSLASLQESLYNMLVDEEANVTSIQEKVAEVNKQNEVVQHSVKEFNDLTTHLNEVKDQAFSTLQNQE